MSFDPDAFLNQTTTDANSTIIEACPEGEYKATVDDGDKAIQFREFNSTKGTGQVYHQMQVFFNILDDNVRAQLKRDKVLVPMNIFLDVTDSGQLDTGQGKNVGVGRLRAALDQNTPGQPWGPAMLKGKGPIMVKVTQRSDKNDPNNKFAEVSRIAKIS